MSSQRGMTIKVAIKHAQTHGADAVVSSAQDKLHVVGPAGWEILSLESGLRPLRRAYVRQAVNLVALKHH
ncbi:MAG: hypothetical protein M3N08_08730 [Pseudomonadota bacterium]|nr:hypothetical protein [Pseudomonadota bacterium]